MTIARSIIVLITVEAQLKNNYARRTPLKISPISRNEPLLFSGNMYIVTRKASLIVLL